MFMKQKIEKDKKQNNTILEKITQKEKQLLFYLYQFRFLHTQQLQKLFNHKNPKRIQQWLKDLKDKGYIQRQDYKNTFENHTKPAIYFLTLKARRRLKNEETYDIEALDKLYKESDRTESFIAYCLTLADIYLFFLSQLHKGEVLKFFTGSQLLRYEYFPNPLPSAYISVKTKGKTKRYFLEFFKDYAKPGVLQSRVKAYIQYIEEGNWEDNANGEPFPMVLFICPTENLKKHIHYYAKAVFKKMYDEPFSLFLTSKETIFSRIKIDIWEKVDLQ